MEDTEYNSFQLQLYIAGVKTVVTFSHINYFCKNVGFSKTKRWDSCNSVENLAHVFTGLKYSFKSHCVFIVLVNNKRRRRKINEWKDCPIGMEIYSLAWKLSYGLFACWNCTCKEGYYCLSTDVMLMRLMTL